MVGPSLHMLNIETLRFIVDLSFAKGRLPHHCVLIISETVVTNQLQLISLQSEANYLLIRVNWSLITSLTQSHSISVDSIAGGILTEGDAGPTRSYTPYSDV